MTTVSAACQKTTLEISLAAFDDARTIFLNLAIRYAMCTFYKRLIPEVSCCSGYLTKKSHRKWLVVLGPVLNGYCFAAAETSCKTLELLW